MEWEYGKMLLKDKQIESLDNWSDDKEYAYSIMDKQFDYLWWEDEEGIHFIDRLYHDGIVDCLTKKRKREYELQLDFKNVNNVIKWIKEKHIEERRQRMKSAWKVQTNDIYRIDYLCYIEGKGCVCKNTVDRIENYLSAKEYIDEVYYNECFPISIEEEFKNCDVIKVEVIEIKTNKTLSTYWWGGNGKENKEDESD